MAAHAGPDRQITENTIDSNRTVSFDFWYDMALMNLIIVQFLSAVRADAKPVSAAVSADLLINYANMAIYPNNT